METMAINDVALCRCGLSTESFCDGTRSKIGLRPVWRAVRQEEGKV